MCIYKIKMFNLKKALNPLSGVKVPRGSTFSLLIIVLNINNYSLATPQTDITSESKTHNKKCDTEQLECISVQGRRYHISTHASKHYITAAETNISAHFADDIFRMIPSLPGVTGNDYSSEFIVRGDEYQNVLVMLDGQQLFRPFHLKDLGGVFSVINNDIVDNLDLSTGGFSSIFGNKMAGVMEVSSLSDTPNNEYSIGASFLNLKANSQGNFSNGEGHWIVSARRGYLDLFFDSAEDEEVPTLEFSDFFAKISFQITPQHQLTAHTLLTNDHLKFDDNYQENDYFIKNQLNSSDPSEYLWLTLNSNWTIDINSTTKIAIGKIIENRTGFNLDPSEINVWVKDYSKFKFFDLSQQWSVLHSNNSTWNLGVGALSNSIQYNYHSYRYLFDAYQKVPELTRYFLNKFKGEKYHAYINHKYRLFNNLLTETGIRWDKQNDLGFDESQISPRASMAYLLSQDAKFRLSWGLYFQPEELFDLQVSDGEKNFNKPQKAEHRILSYQHILPKGIHLGVEVYQKLISDPLVRYENVFDSLVPFPESNVDRIKISPEKSTMKGLEISLNQEVNYKLSWSANYTYSKTQDIIDGVKVNRSWDQRHAVNAKLNYLFENGWQSNIALTYHSGWPTTLAHGITNRLPTGEYQLQKTIGKRNTENLNDYFRLDLRFSKSIQFDNSELNYFVEIFNLTDRKNECCVLSNNFSINGDGTVEVVQEKETWAGIVPSAGILWRF